MPYVIDRGVKLWYQVRGEGQPIVLSGGFGLLHNQWDAVRVITAAAMQIDACIPNFLIQESIYKSRGFFDEIAREPFEWHEGDLILQDRPGIGVALVVEELGKYAA
jgi:L-alanine-DL-glutamate epimerase-like enolase superfamily enzyme